MICIASAIAIGCIAWYVVSSPFPRVEGDSELHIPGELCLGLFASLLVGLASWWVGLLFGIAWLIGYFVYRKAKNASQSSEVAKEAAIEEVRKRLAESPLDEKLQDELLALSVGCPELLNSTYKLALTILGDHTDSLSARQFALNAGRASYSALRPDQTPTMYDEQAIQNDILVRTGNTAARQVAKVASDTTPVPI